MKGVSEELQLKIKAQADIIKDLKSKCKDMREHHSGKIKLAKRRIEILNSKVAENRSQIMVEKQQRKEDAKLILRPPPAALQFLSAIVDQFSAKQGSATASNTQHDAAAASNTQRAQPQ